MSKEMHKIDSIEAFLKYLKVERRYSSLTIEAYGRDLYQFATWLSTSLGNNDFIVKDVTTSDIRAWLGTLADNKISATSLRRKTQSLRAFFRWEMQANVIASNPATDIVLAKKPKRLPDYIKETEIEELLKQQSNSFQAHRTHIAITLLYCLGLRQAELLTLTDADINTTLKEIRITGKRNKQRIVPLPSELAIEIKEWQEIRDNKYPDLPHPRPLLAGPHGHITKQSLYNIVKTGLNSVSAQKKSPHTLRHTFATSMVNNGADLDAVREMLGHSSLSTTQIYTHLSFKELQKNYTHSHPRANKSDSLQNKEK